MYTSYKSVLTAEKIKVNSFGSSRKSEQRKFANARTVFAELKLSWLASLAISVVNVVCK